MSLTNRQLFGVKFKDKQYPDGVMASIAAHFKAGYGAAFVDNDPLTADKDKLRILWSDDPITVPEMKGWMEHLKDVTVLITATDAEKPLIQADYQPFVVLRSDKDYPICVAAIHGDFTVCEDENSERTTASISLDEHIQPILAKTFTECGNDLKKFFEAISTPEAVKKIFAQTKNGWMLFLGIDGSTKSIIKGDLEKAKLVDPKWGWLSANPDAEGMPATAKKAPDPVTKPAAEHKPRTFGGVKKTEETKPDKEPIKIDNPQPDTAAPPDKEITTQLAMGYTIENGALFYQCPKGPGYETWNQVREAYKRNLNTADAPNPYKTHPKIQVTDPQVLARFKDVLAGSTKITQPAEGKTPKDFPKAHEEVARHITADEKKKLSELLLGDDVALASVDKKDDLVPEQELEEEYTTFAEATGVSDDVLMSQRFRPEFLAKIRDECPVSFLQLVIDWRKKAMMALHRVKSLEARIAEDEAKPEPVKQPEHKARSFGGVKKSA